MSIHHRGTDFHTEGERLQFNKTCMELLNTSQAYTTSLLDMWFSARAFFAPSAFGNSAGDAYQHGQPGETENEELMRLRHEMDALREIAQRDKDDATKANVLLVQAERKLEDAAHHIDSLTDERDTARAENVHLMNDNRIRAWHQITAHPVMLPAFNHEGSLVDGMMKRLTDLYEIEKTVNELRPVREADTATLAEGSKPTVTRLGRSDAELREIAMSLSEANINQVFTAKHLYNFFTESETGVEDRIQAATYTRGSITMAREVLAFLKGENQTSNFTD